VPIIGIRNYKRNWNPGLQHNLGMAADFSLKEKNILVRWHTGLPNV
jgi:hypothetical protein